MADLYNRIEEIQGMVRVLTGDLSLLEPHLGSRDIQDAVTENNYAHRRFYVRAIFALVEAIVEQHRRLLLDLVEQKAVVLKPGVPEVLRERVVFVKEDGSVAERDQYLQLERKLRAVYRAAGDAFLQEIATSFADQGWVSFREAVGIRNRLTHPKSHSDCHVHLHDLVTVEQGQLWFKGLNNEFVRIAHAHRKNHHW